MGKSVQERKRHSLRKQNRPYHTNIRFVLESDVFCLNEPICYGSHDMLTCSAEIMNSTIALSNPPSATLDTDVATHLFHPKFLEVFARIYNDELKRSPEIFWEYELPGVGTETPTSVEEIQSYLNLTSGIKRVASLKALFECVLTQSTKNTFLVQHEAVKNRFMMILLQTPLEDEHTGTIIFTVKAPYSAPLGPLIEELVGLATFNGYSHCEKSKMTEGSDRITRLSRKKD